MGAPWAPTSLSPHGSRGAVVCWQHLGLPPFAPAPPPPIMVTLEVGSVWGSWDCCSGDEGSEAHIHVQDTLTSVRKSTGGAIEQPKK
jgi:hypothetical protein